MSISDASRAHLPLGPGAEFDIVRSLLARWGNAAEGVGDDAAVLVVPRGQQLVVSTDTSLENVHFRRAWLSPDEIGYRAGAAALSDLAAMAAEPLGMTVAITLPESWRADVEVLADGLAEVAKHSGSPIVGGDLTRGRDLAITITVLGTSAAPLRRNGARTGDVVWVTGALGGSRLALRALERGAVPAEAHRQRFARPSPRLREARWLQANGASAGIDCSDGLAADLAHLAAASRAHVVLALDRVPCASGASMEDAAQSGEEYELIVTAPATLDVTAFEAEFGLPLTAIGRVTSTGAERAEVRATHHGAVVAIPAGHDHFAV